MLIRIQTPEGTKRIECTQAESISSLASKIQSAFGFPTKDCFTLFKDRTNIHKIQPLDRSLKYFKIGHGDILYLTPIAAPVSSTLPASSNSSQRSTTSFIPPLVPEDSVDIILHKADGSIDRKRDERLCRHGANAKCIHCTPLEPYDEAYLKEQNIKHMSFHSLLRKLSGGIDRGKFAVLENISCKIKDNCTEHLPWPEGICTKCQPNAVTLNRQDYRHVDNVTFENPFLVERFLDYWRCTGHQRLGLLYGRYEVHKDVPLGIKASVSAIYEPPQESSREQIKLLADDKLELVDRIAKGLQLQRVGWIFTDLIADNLQKGTVKHLRGANSYFLSAQECIMAGHFQNQHPNRCKVATDGYFGSKFATVCVTGDMENQVHMEGYQVSNQCMALVRDKCLVPTKDSPELGYVKESTNEQYIPDVFYKDKDSYGNEVPQLARPLPIEYLLVDVPASTPVEPQFTFYTDPSTKAFPVENRLLEGHIQDISALTSYLKQFPSERFLESMSDFHLLIYLAGSDVLPLRDHIDELLESVLTKNQDLANNWSKTEGWATVQHIVNAQETSMDMATDTAMGAQTDPSSMLTCRHCTFLNQPGTANCVMCGLPQ